MASRVVIPHVAVATTTAQRFAGLRAMGHTVDTYIVRVTCRGKPTSADATVVRNMWQELRENFRV